MLLEGAYSTNVSNTIGKVKLNFGTAHGPGSNFRAPQRPKMPVVDQGLFAPRRGAAKVGRARRDTMACVAADDASTAVTTRPASLVEVEKQPRGDVRQHERGLRRTI